MNYDGTSDDDTIYGSTASDVINAYEGDDDVYGDGGDDYIDGGDGEDRLYGEGGNDEIDGGADNDLLDGGDGEDTLAGGAGRDSLYGGADNDTLLGGDGNDTLDGGAGTDIAQGGAGNDTYFVDSASDVVLENAGEGDDHVRSTALSYALTADIERLTFIGFGNFTGTGNAGNNIITGGLGNDTLIGGAGADTLNGDGGTDTASYATSAAGVTVNLTTGVNAGGDAEGDVLNGIENLTGSAFADTLTGNSGVNTLTGGGGNDTLNGGAGADTLIGGTGSDTASYVTSAAGVTVNLATGINTGGDAEGDTLIAIENLTGSAYDDSLTGNNGANVLAGGGGDDTFYFTVGGATDRIDGGTETNADTLDITGTANGDTFFFETVADYNARTGGSSAGPAELLVSVGSSIQTEVNEIEKVSIHGGAGADTLTISGSFTATSLAAAPISFDAGTGDDIVDVSDRASAHAIVADGGDEDTATGDVAILGFAFGDATYEAIEDENQNVLGVKVTHIVGGTPITDEFTDFESFQFTDGTKTLEDLFVPPVSPVSFGFTTALAGGTTRISVNSSEVQGNAVSGLGFASADGRYVAFYSEASNLVADDTNNFVDTFVRDLLTGTTVRVSVDSNESQATGGHSGGQTGISADGRYVAFQSDASNLVAGDTNGVGDVFVRDLLAGTTTRVSLDSAEGQANGHSGQPTISANGRYVVFYSTASNLVANDTNNLADIFVRDLITGTTTLVSADLAGNPGTGIGRTAISNDGRYVAFSSSSPNLVSGDTNSAKDVFVRDLVAGTTTLISVTSAEAQATGDSQNPSMSGDGRYIVFNSLAEDLVAGDTNSASDIFVRDMVTGTTTRVSVATGGAQANGASNGCAISEDGRYITFDSHATNLVSGDTNGVKDTFIHDLVTGITTRISTNSVGGQSNGDSGVGSHAISEDGAHVVFSSTGTNLVSGDTNGVGDSFLSERKLQWNEVAVDIDYSGAGPDSYLINWGDGETTAHSLWGGLEARVRHDYAANVTGTGTIHAQSNGVDVATTTFSVQTAPSGTSGTTLTGTGGVDILISHDGPDTLNGLGGSDMLSGGLGADTIDGGNGADNLRGGAGNDTLTGGAGDDVFVFQASFGHDTVTDFVAGAGSDDVIEIHDGLFANFAAVQAASQQVGSDVVITYDVSNSITLQNVTLASLHQDDFLFV